MATVTLRIEPELLGNTGISVGTINHVKVLQRRLGISVGAAKTLVDRAVFEGEVVSIDVETEDEARLLAEELSALPGPARTVASVD